MPETVVLLHGIWMPRQVMWLLARRLRHCGYRTRLFGYPSLRRSAPDNAGRLAQFVRRCDGRVHLVGHSLGGLVILHALQADPDLVAGRIVLLGSPVNGSVVARRLQRFAWTRWLIGRASDQALLGDGPHWRGGRPLGLIAGTRPHGIGRLLGGLSGDNDGTVTVAETVLPMASASTTFPTTHMGLVFSRRVARAVCRFLEQGRFDTLR
jgi:pimeloyl-ACP methyl ester carboxylesterase